MPSFWPLPPPLWPWWMLWALATIKPRRVARQQDVAGTARLWMMAMAAMAVRSPQLTLAKKYNFSANGASSAGSCVNQNTVLTFGDLDLIDDEYVVCMYVCTHCSHFAPNFWQVLTRSSIRFFDTHMIDS